MWQTWRKFSKSSLSILLLLSSPLRKTVTKPGYLAHSYATNKKYFFSIQCFSKAESRAVYTFSKESVFSEYIFHIMYWKLYCFLNKSHNVTLKIFFYILTVLKSDNINIKNFLKNHYFLFFQKVCYKQISLSFPQQKLCITSDAFCQSSKLKSAMTWPNYWFSISVLKTQLLLALKAYVFLTSCHCRRYVNSFKKVCQDLKF